MSTLLALVALSLSPVPQTWGALFHGHSGSDCGKSSGAAKCYPPLGPWTPNNGHVPYDPTPPCGYVIVGTPGRPLPDNQAQIRVILPAGARLTVNGQPVPGFGSPRLLTTPVIAPGQDHHYSLRAEYVVNGAVRTVNRDVEVRGGWVTYVDFEELTGAR